MQENKIHIVEISEESENDNIPSTGYRRYTVELLPSPDVQMPQSPDVPAARMKENTIHIEDISKETSANAYIPNTAHCCHVELPLSPGERIPRSYDVQSPLPSYVQRPYSYVVRPGAPHLEDITSATNLSSTKVNATSESDLSSREIYTGAGFVLPNEVGPLHTNAQQLLDSVLPDVVVSVHTNGQQLLDPEPDREEGCCSPDCYMICITWSLPVIIIQLVLFLLVSLILYNVSKHQKPVITMESITFHHFSVSDGSDFPGLETYLVSVNSTVKFTYRNTATFFRVKVTMSKPLNLNFLELKLVTGNMKDFYQSKKSQRTVEVEVSGNQNIPMYGPAASFISYGGMWVPLNLDFAIHSRGYVLGSLVERQFDMNIYCSVIFEPKKLEVPLSLDDCTFKQNLFPESQKNNTGLAPL